MQLSDIGRALKRLAQSQDRFAANAVAFLCFIAVLLVALTQHYWHVLSGQAAYFLQDHCYFFEPLTRYIAERLRAGQLPLWNPYCYCGMSQIANPSPNALYPFYLLFVFMPYSQALGLILLVHQLIGAAGCYFLVVELGWGIAAGIVCGVVFALSGYMYTLLANYTLVISAAWIPFSMYTLWQLGDAALLPGRRKFVFFGLAALSTFLLIAGGRPEVFAPACALNLLVVLFRKRESAALWWRSVVFQIAALAAGILLTMPVLMPMYEWSTRSTRRSGQDMQVSLMWSVNWYDWFMLAFSQALGDLQLLGNKFLVLVTTRTTYMPFLPSTFVGPTALTLAMWGYCDRRWWWRWQVLVLFVFTIVMCLGEFTPIAPWLETTVHFLSIFRYPVKWMIFITFFLAVGAARGISMIQHRRLGKKALFFSVTIWCLFILTGLGFIALSKADFTFRKPHDLYRELQLIIAPYMIWGSVGGLAACLVGWLVSRRRLLPLYGVAVLVAGLFLHDVVDARIYTQQTAFHSFYEHVPFLKKALEAVGMQPNDRVLPALSDPIETPAGFTVGARVPETPNYFAYAQTLLWPNTNIDWHVREIYGYESCATRNYVNLYNSVMSKSWACKKHKCAETERDKEREKAKNKREGKGAKSARRGQASSSKESAGLEFGEESEAEANPESALEKNTDLDDRSDVAPEPDYGDTRNGAIDDDTALYSDAAKAEKSGDAAGKSERADREERRKLSDFPLYRFCQTTATKWIVTQVIRCGDKHAPGLDLNYFQPIYEDSLLNFRIYRVKNTLPRAYLSQYFVYKKSQPSALDKMSNCHKHKYNPALVTWVFANAKSGDVDAIRGTELSESPLLPLPPKTAPPVPEAIRHSTDWSARDPLIEKFPVSVLIDDPEHVSLSFKTDRNCWLVLTDHYFPGWQAAVDGVKRPIYKCNNDMRAVYVPPGAHLIEFNYEPESFKVGCYLALAGLLTVLAAFGRAIAPYLWHLIKRMAGQA